MQTDVVIVGGGLSGLAAARALHAADVDFRLLEARDRWGGRVLSIEAPGSGGDASDPVSLDAGPAWFWPGQARIARLVEDLGLTVFLQHSAGMAAFEGADGTVRRDRSFALNAEGMRVAGGLSQVTDRLAQSLPSERLKLDHPVYRIERIAGGWRVLTTAANRTTIDARAVIVTVPPRLAGEAIGFDPPLSPETMAAMRGVPTWMAGHAKALVTFDHPFWRAHGLSGDAISHRGPLVQIHDASPPAGEIGGLFGFLGLPANERSRAGEAVLRRAITRQLGQIFGPEAETPTAIRIVDWADERFTATVADHDLPRSHPVYGMPPALRALTDDGLIFASTELAPDNGGLLEGALAAAERAVGSIVAPTKLRPAVNT